MLTDKTCTICGATPVVARGWCWAHYKRWRRSGDPNAEVRAVNKGQTCGVGGCLRPAVIKGLCKMHDKRQRKTGDVGPAGRLRAQTVEVCFCGLPAQENGYCAAHQ